MFWRLSQRRVDGTVVTWGDTSDSQRDDAPVDANFVAISCAWHHSVGLRADGTVVTWGGTDASDDAPTDSNFVAVVCGRVHGLGLRSAVRNN